jgi:hypothetical protein
MEDNKGSMMEDKKLGWCSVIYRDGPEETFKCTMEDFQRLLRFMDEGKQDWWMGEWFSVRISDISSAHFNENFKESHTGCLDDNHDFGNRFDQAKKGVKIEKVIEVEHDEHLLDFGTDGKYKITWCWSCPPDEKGEVRISLEKQSFYCMTCHNAGDVFEVMNDLHGSTSLESLDYLERHKDKYQ